MKISLDDIKNKTGNVLDKTKEMVGNTKNSVVESSNKIAKKTTENFDISKKKVIQAMDQNGDNELTIEDVIIAGLKVPGIKIKRDDFLKKEFGTKYNNEIVNKIVEKNPLSVNISLAEVDSR